MLHKRNKKGETVSMEHYAPQVTVTAIDYIIPFSHKSYMKEMEARIKEALAKMKLDAMSGAYFDASALADKQVFLAMLRQQIPEHKDANRSIADKHAAELERLDSALLRTNKLIEMHEQEISALQELYDRCNS